MALLGANARTRPGAWSSRIVVGLDDARRDVEPFYVAQKLVCRALQTFADARRGSEKDRKAPSLSCALRLQRVEAAGRGPDASSDGSLLQLIEGVIEEQSIDGRFTQNAEGTFLVWVDERLTRSGEIGPQYGDPT